MFESGRGNEAGRRFNFNTRVVLDITPQAAATDPGAPIDAGEAPAQGPETARRHAVGVADLGADDADGPSAQVLPHAARVAAAGRRLKLIPPPPPVPPPPRLVSTEQRMILTRVPSNALRRGFGPGDFSESPTRTDGRGIYICDSHLVKQTRALRGEVRADVLRQARRLPKSRDVVALALRQRSSQAVLRDHEPRHAVERFQ